VAVVDAEGLETTEGNWVDTIGVIDTEWDPGVALEAFAEVLSVTVSPSETIKPTWVEVNDSTADDVADNSADVEDEVEDDFLATVVIEVGDDVAAALAIDVDPGAELNGLLVEEAAVPEVVCAEPW